MLLEALQFGIYLQEERSWKNVSQDDLGEGLFTEGGVSKVESGERYPDKMMRDRLAARLGESGYDYEYYLQWEEYEDWEERRELIDSLEDGDAEKAELLLKQYEKKHDMTHPVIRQFFLVMQLQRMELLNCPEEEKKQIVDEAAGLTMPNIDTKKVTDCILSRQELNLALEYFRFRPELFEQKFEELKKALETRAFDPESMAELVSRMALCYSRFKHTQLEAADSEKERLRLAEQALLICTWGIEALRDHNKLYFIFELLELQNRFLTVLLQSRELSMEKREALKEEQQQNRRFYDLFDRLYSKYQVRKETNSFTCFYREHEVYCINDVLRARRKMFGVPRHELEDICGESTVKRLEKGKTKVQRAVAQRLFHRFGLSMELHRAPIITSSQKAVWLEKEFRFLHNRGQLEQALQCLERLKGMVPMEDTINKQRILYDELLIEKKLGKISTEEYLVRAVEFLEYTIPQEIALEKVQDKRLANGRLQTGEKYLTNEEVTILTNLGTYSEGAEKEKYWRALEEYFTILEKKCTLAPVLSMYGFSMRCIASHYGNGGNYERSNEMVLKMLRESLRLHTVTYACDYLYDLLWNDRMEQGLPMVLEDPAWKNGLQDCLTIAEYYKQLKDIKWIRGKLEMN